MTNRLTGIVVRPRATLAEVSARPSWAGTWVILLAVWAACGGWLLSTPVGRQALVDERVRAIEAFGGTVGDADYTSWQQSPPWWVYFTSGSRLLLFPAATLGVAAALWAAARIDGAAAALTQSLALTVHATAVLVIGQVLATPLHYIRESLTSPFNLAAVLPLMEDGTLAARFFGSLDLFVLWWLGLLALGMSRLTRRRARRYLWSLAAVYVAIAAVVAGVMASVGGA